MTPADRTRLAKLCGLFSSAHAGERASAAAKADALVRSLGLRWPDVLDPWPGDRSDDQVVGPTPVELRACLAVVMSAPGLTKWERDFARRIDHARRATPRQWAVLSKIRESLRRAAPSAQ